MDLQFNIINENPQVIQITRGKYANRYLYGWHKMNNGEKISEISVDSNKNFHMITSKNRKLSLVHNTKFSVQFCPNVIIKYCVRIEKPTQNHITIRCYNDIEYFDKPCDYEENNVEPILYISIIYSSIDNSYTFDGTLYDDPYKLTGAIDAVKNMLVSCGFSESKSIVLKRDFEFQGNMHKKFSELETKCDIALRMLKLLTDKFDIALDKRTLAQIQKITNINAEEPIEDNEPSIGPIDPDL